MVVCESSVRDEGGWSVFCRLGGKVLLINFVSRVLLYRNVRS